MTRLEEYETRFTQIRIRREDGVLEMTIHRNGGTAKWDYGPKHGIHKELGEAFRMIADDPENRAVILTGAGEAFLTEIDRGNGSDVDPPGAHFWDRIYREGKALLLNLLDIGVPVIGAVNGNAFIHAELAVMSDIVLAAEHARFADKAHYPSGVSPSDGVHVVWPMLLGPNRGRYFLLTGEEIPADEAKRLGFVAEVLPRDRLMPRAWELARMIAGKPRLASQYARVALTQELKRRMVAELSHGLALEGVGFTGN